MSPEFIRAVERRDSWMSQDQVELVVRTIAQTAIDNEKYFGDLDSVVGDGDFGYSLPAGSTGCWRAGTASTAPTRAPS
jgi:hypothetical protein